MTTNLHILIIVLTVFLVISPSLQLQRLQGNNNLPTHVAAISTLNTTIAIRHRDGPPPSPMMNKSAIAPVGTRWAILVAGSKNFVNYRHQSDVCHAYHVLKRGGLKDENTVVFMYDDIAFDVDNPHPGVLINKPTGHDVYTGVPKDYTRENCTADNFYAVILGNQSVLTRGSGKVVNSGPDDTIFIYYSDHGAPGIVGMPVGKSVNAIELMDVLNRKHIGNGYKSMVIYMEACEGGSMFDGDL